MVPFFEAKKEIPTKERIPNEETSREAVAAANLAFRCRTRMRRGREKLVGLANTIRVLPCESVYKRATAPSGSPTRRWKFR
jgi:hypothetical protein